MRGWNFPNVIFHHFRWQNYIYHKYWCAHVERFSSTILKGIIFYPFHNEFFSKKSTVTFCFNSWKKNCIIYQSTSYIGVTIPIFRSRTTCSELLVWAYFSYFPAFKWVVSGKLPPREFPLIKLPHLVNSPRGIPARGYPTQNIPSHVLKYSHPGFF